MKASRQDIARAVDKLDTSLRLILLHGPDEAGSRALGKRFENAAGSGFDKIDLNPAELKNDPARLADEAAATSMFGSATLIRITGIGDESAQAVSALLDAPQAGNPVLAYAGALRKDSKLLKLVEAASHALHFASYPMEGRDATGEAQMLCRSAGVQLDNNSLQLLIEAAAGDRAILANEVEKLALYADASPDNPQSLTADVIETLVAGLTESDLSQLVNAVFSGIPSAVEHQIWQAHLEGIAGIALLRSALRRANLIVDLRHEIDQGASIDAAMAKKGRAIFWKDKPIVTGQLHLWPSDAAIRAVSALLDAERQIKQSHSAGDIIAESVLLTLAQYAARRQNSGRRAYARRDT